MKKFFILIIVCIFSLGSCNKGAKDSPSDVNMNRDDYPIQIKFNVVEKVDLDGDGIEEEIYIIGDDLYINDMCVNVYIYDNFKVEIFGGTAWITNIDPNDNWKEMVLSAKGSEGYLVYLYTDGVLEQVDEWDGYNGTIDQMKYNQDGTITWPTEVYLLNRYVINLKRELNDEHKLESIWEESYDLTEFFNNREISLLANICVYTEKDYNGNSIELTPQKVYILETDGRNWTRIMGEDRVAGWLYTNDEGVIINFENPVHELFDGFSDAG